MKNITQLFLVCLAFPLFSSAQPLVKKALPVKVDLGLKIGTNFANMNGDEWEGGYRSGITGGIFGGIRMKKVGVQVEALFSRVKYTGNGLNFL